MATPGRNGKKAERKDRAWLWYHRFMFTYIAILLTAIVLLLLADR